MLPLMGVHVVPLFKVHNELSNLFSLTSLKCNQEALWILFNIMADIMTIYEGSAMRFSGSPQLQQSKWARDWPLGMAPKKTPGVTGCYRRLNLVFPSLLQ